MIFTTNKALKAWGGVLHDEDLAQAIIDRVLERGRLIRLDGPSIRTLHLKLDDALKDESDQDAEVARISGNKWPEFPEPTQLGRTSWLKASRDTHGARATLGVRVRTVGGVVVTLHRRKNLVNRVFRWSLSPDEAPLVWLVMATRVARSSNAPSHAHLRQTQFREARGESQ